MLIYHQIGSRFTGMNGPKKLGRSISAFTYLFIEEPGIRLGRKLVQRYSN